MHKKIVYALLILAVIFSLFNVIERIRVEDGNKTVDLVIDYQALHKLAEENNTEVNYILDMLAEELTAVAIYEQDLEELIEKKAVNLITADELVKIKNLTGEINPILESFSYDQDSAFIVIEDKLLQERFAGLLPGWTKEYQAVISEVEQGIIVFFPDWKESYLSLNMGFSQREITRIREVGLQVVPRLNNDLPGELSLEQIREIKPELLIFAGEEIRGYPADIEQTAQLLNRQNIKFGMIEAFIAAQKGAGSLARQLDYNLVRVHSIQQAEMNKYSQNKIIDRYLRAVRERDVRVLYLKPFLKDRGKGDLAELNQQYMVKLVQQLEGEGYQPGSASPYPDFGRSTAFLLLTGIGILAGVVLLLEYLLGRETWWSWLMLLLSLLGEIAFILLGKEILIRQMLALVASIVFPSLAVISQLLTGKREQNFLRRYLQAGLISMLGVLFVTASLTGVNFLTKVDQFRGVKLSFVMPLLIISYYYFRYRLPQNQGKTALRSILDLLEANIKVKHVLLVFLLGIGGIFYLGRTGNYSILPVPAWEIVLREQLENLLYIRPRFKEFMLGHPFLILTLGLQERIRSWLVIYPLIILASIGQITILNTFSHIHTPLIVSLIRVFHGYWLGLLLGLILLYAVKYIYSLREKVQVEDNE